MKERQVLDEKYVVIRSLGSGPTGSLYEAENLMLGKRVAIKMINPALARRPGVAERVLARAKEAASLDHPNVASLLDLGEFEGAPYLVMEQVSGHTLEREIDTGASSSVAAACDLVLQVLAALDYAHANGVVHGALHPNNVLIAYPRPGVPWVKVSDFGLFQSLEDIHGDGPNPAGGYRAPEYGGSEGIDHRADVYSAAALLHALLHGMPPGTEAEKSSRVPAELTEILVDALRPNPLHRTESAQLLANRLAPFAQEPSRLGDIRLSSPPSIRWMDATGPTFQPQVPALAPSADPPIAEWRGSIEPARGTEPPAKRSFLTESLLRNPRFPNDSTSPWAKRWRLIRQNLAAHPSVGAAWLFAIASVSAGIACALLAAWLQ